MKILISFCPKTHATMPLDAIIVRTVVRKYTWNKTWKSYCAFTAATTEM